MVLERAFKDDAQVSALASEQHGGNMIISGLDTFRVPSKAWIFETGDKERDLCYVLGDNRKS